MIKGKKSETSSIIEGWWKICVRDAQMFCSIRYTGNKNED